MQKEPVISVKDLLAECVRKAVVIIILAVIFAVLLCGYKYYVDSLALAESQKAELLQSEMGEESSTEKDQEEIEEYLQLLHAKSEIEEYLNTSVLVNCNPYDVNFVQLQYAISTEVVDSKREVVLSVINYITGGGLASDLSAEQSEMEAKYYQELIVCEGMNYGSYLDNGIIQIKMYAIDADHAKEFARLVDEKVQNYSNTLNTNGMLHGIQKMNEAYSSVINESYITKRNDLETKLSEYEDKVATAEQALSYEQKAAVNSLLETEVEAQESEALPISEVRISKKYFVLGGMIGVVLAVVFIALQYIFSNTVKTATDIQNMYQITHLGQLSCKSFTIWEKIANRIFYSRNSFNIEIEKQMIVSKLTLFCKKNNIDQIAIVIGAVSQEESHIQEVAKELKENGVICKIANNILENGEEVKNLEELDNVVIVQKIKKANYESVENEILFFKSQNISVIGYITLI